MPRKLGDNQKFFLRSVGDHGWWFSGCGWIWDSYSGTLRICESLVQRGYLTRIPMASSSWRQENRYELTDTGREAISFQGEPIHLKVGYAMLREKDAIRARLVAGGMTDQTELHFAVKAAYEEAHKADKTLRERQEADQARKRQRWREEQAKRPMAPAATLFTVEELRLLIAHFDRANDPVAAAIGAKAKVTLRKANHPV